MTEQLGTRFPQFYLTQPSACPYLPGRHERKVFTKLTGGLSRQVHESLTRVGFRRSQNIAYRPACDGCSACTSVRILVDAFEPSRNMRRTIGANADVAAAFAGPLATEEQFHLLRRYLDGRHRGGGMSEMGILDYVAMVEDTTIDTHVVEYRSRSDGRLIACALSDAMSDGLSMVYSFFDPQEDLRSLGTYMVLHHIEAARARNLPYVYLGYLVEGCRKMSYKARFGPLEAHGPDGWVAYKAR
jgi:leucyl-tRNA---protein transferase